MKRLHMEKRDHLGWVHLDDGKANAIQEEMLSQLDVAMDTFERDPDLHGVVLSSVSTTRSLAFPRCRGN